MGKVEASAAFENSVLVACDMLERINDLLHSMPSPDSGKIDWSHVGSVTQLNSQLHNLIQFVESSLPK